MGRNNRALESSPPTGLPTDQPEELADLYRDADELTGEIAEPEQANTELEDALRAEFEQVYTEREADLEAAAAAKPMACALGSGAWVPAALEEASIRGVTDGRRRSRLPRRPLAAPAVRCLASARKDRQP